MSQLAYSRMALRIVATLVATGLVAACGYKGPLYMPTPDGKPPSTAKQQKQQPIIPPAPRCLTRQDGMRLGSQARQTTKAPHGAGRNPGRSELAVGMQADRYMFTPRKAKPVISRPVSAQYAAMVPRRP